MSDPVPLRNRIPQARRDAIVSKVGSVKVSRWTFVHLLDRLIEEDEKVLLAQVDISFGHNALDVDNELSTLVGFAQSPSFERLLGARFLRERALANPEVVASCIEVQALVDAEIAAADKMREEHCALQADIRAHHEQLARTKAKFERSPEIEAAEKKLQAARDAAAAFAQANPLS